MGACKKSLEEEDSCSCALSKKSLKLTDAIISTALSEKNNLFNLGVNSNVELVPNGININEASLKNHGSVQKLSYIWGYCVLIRAQVF